jgi:hypothetical protein
MLAVRPIPAHPEHLLVLTGQDSRRVVVIALVYD